MENRWKQRFERLKSAFLQLQKACSKLQKIEMHLLADTETDEEDYIRDSVIKRFELVFELAWKTIKDIFAAAGRTEILGSRDAIRMAFSEGMLDDGEVWMAMVRTRNETTHLYDTGMAKLSAEKIAGEYLAQFSLFIKYLEGKL